MGFMQAKRTYHTRIDGRRIRVKEGEIRDEKDPVVKGSPRHWKLVRSAASTGRRSGSDVEQATAVPGEKRSIGRPRKKAEPAEPDTPDESGTEK